MGRFTRNHCRAVRPHYWLYALIAGLVLGLSGTARGAGVTAGDPAPPVALPGLAGAPGVSLASLRGKVVYLDFWASWCGPCRLSFPQLEQLRAELGPRGFEVLAVNLDESEADAHRFLEEVPVSYPIVRDAQGSTPALYGILGMPTAYLIDRAGIVHLVHQGYRRSDGDKLPARNPRAVGGWMMLTHLASGLARAPVRATLLTLALVALGGCETVQPWERGTLAKDEMQWQPELLESRLQSQVHYSKEASSGGTAAAGGGCGCN